MNANEQMSIGGEWRDVMDGATSPVHDPSDGSVLAHIPMATVDDVDAAVAASRAALHDPACAPWTPRSEAECSVGSPR